MTEILFPQNKKDNRTQRGASCGAIHYLNTKLFSNEQEKQRRLEKSDGLILQLPFSPTVGEGNFFSRRVSL